MLARLVLISMLLGSAIVVDTGTSKQLALAGSGWLIGLVILIYASTLGWVLWLNSGRPLRRQAQTQLVADASAISALVFLTGGLDSLFTFLYLLAIISGSVLLGRSGATLVVLCAAVGLGINALAQYFPPGWMLDLFPGLPLGQGRVPVYSLLVHWVAFQSVATLSSQLSEKLGQMGSELERRQLDLRELRALHDNILRSVDAGLLTLDERDQVIFANQSAERILGRPLRLQLFRPLSTMVPALMAAIERLKRRGERYREDLALEQPDGTVRWVSLSLSALRGPDDRGQGWIVILEDLTEMRALREQVARQQKLASIGNLAAGIAHEIRNPLAAISGSVEILRLEEGQNPEQQELMTIVLREVDRLNGLIREFLDYARPRSIHVRPCELSGLVDEVARLLGQDPEVARGVEIRVQDALPAGLTVMMDPDRIRQVLWNLLRNACEVTGAGGCVQVRLNLQSERESDAPVAVLYVDDEGPGIPDHVQARIFEPFFTTKFDGTGLGLATSDRIVTEHGGSLEASNRAGGGARFTMRLPLRGPMAEVSGLSDSQEIRHAPG
jgi:two-component system sensor histidine kinase PilS (NtrC family)